MAVPKKFLLFLTLVPIAAAQQLETDYIHDPGEATREFILEQNEEMKKFLKEEMQKMFATMKVELSETLRRDHQQLSESISNLKTLFPPPTLTEVEEVNAESGTIEFTGGTNPHLRTKIWALQSKGGSSLREMSFLLVENRLGEAARLSLWGSWHGDGKQETWTGSQDDWRGEKRNSGSVILVTLRISAGGAETPSFKLKFNTTHTESDSVHASVALLGKGRQEVSFPPNNTQNDPRRSLFVAVVAPPQGGSFGLTLKFLDLPGTPPNNCDNEFVVWFLQENSTGLAFTRLSSTVVRRCGRVGEISEQLGNSTVAILRFHSNNGPVGRGFRVDVN